MDIIRLSKWIPNLKRPVVIAGPCSAESEEQVLETAHELAQIEDVRLFRAGIWKPRTRPYTFEGVGEVGLQWLKRVKEETRLMTTTEVANAKHAELALKYNIDVIWIGARTTVNPFSVQEIADALKGTNVPVMVKNPINADLALWMGAIERLHGSGLKKLAAIHRGFSTGEKSKYRNQPMWKIPIELKRRLPDLPMICDPSHITGKRDMVGLVCQKAMDVDMEGLMVETHMTPDQALSDAAQQVTPQMLQEIISGLNLRTEFSPDRTFEEELALLREKIDRIDRDIVDNLANRMEIVEKIGEAKIKTNVTAFQVHRMLEMVNERLKRGRELGLAEQFVKEIYDIIHSESVRFQTEMMQKQKANKKSGS